MDRKQSTDKDIIEFAERSKKYSAQVIGIVHLLTERRLSIGNITVDKVFEAEGGNGVPDPGTREFYEGAVNYITENLDQVVAILQKRPRKQ